MGGVHGNRHAQYPQYSILLRIASSHISLLTSPHPPHTPHRQGDTLLLFDERPNGELLLTCGQVEANNPSNFLTLNVGLLQADRMYTMKKQVVEELGFAEQQEFPVYADKMPVQLLSYLRCVFVGCLCVQVCASVRVLAPGLPSFFSPQTHPPTHQTGWPASVTLHSLPR